MTTMREVAINKPLGGLELRDLIRADFERLLAGEGSLAAHIAYGRVGYQIILRLHTQNPMMPVTEIQMTTRPIAANLIAAHKDPTDPDVMIPARPELAAVDAAPLPDAGPDASVGGITLERRINSPNAERVREGIPVPVEVRQQDGTKTVEQVVYPRQDDGPGDLTIADTTAEARQAWMR